MDTLVAFCKKIRLGKLFTVLAASFVLLLNVACSNGNAVGARPNNPPVQMGGQNNPHKAGGDGYSEQQMSTDPAVTKRDRASISGQLVASLNADRSFSESRSQGKNAASSVSGNAMRDTMKEAKQIPEQPQEVIDRSDPNAKILEKTGRTFKEASKHLTGATDQSIERSNAGQ
ncbi:MAG: DUF6658 family protein [Leptolyngbya sp. BL-A-14]